jgi:hypothetical protein
VFNAEVKPEVKVKVKVSAEVNAKLITEANAEVNNRIKVGPLPSQFAWVPAKLPAKLVSIHESESNPADQSAAKEGRRAKRPSPLLPARKNPATRVFRLAFRCHPEGHTRSADG